MVTSRHSPRPASLAHESRLMGPVLAVTYIPEPASLALGVFAALMVLGGNRKRAS